MFCFHNGIVPAHETLTKALHHLQGLEVLVLKTAPKNEIWPILSRRRNLKQLQWTRSILAKDLEMLRATLPKVQIQKAK
jgi:hypothetical protein